MGWMAEESQLHYNDERVTTWVSGGYVWRNVNNDGEVTTWVPDGNGWRKEDNEKEDK